MAKCLDFASKWLLLAVALAFPACGCGGAGCVVSGQVSMDGVAIESGEIKFYPESDDNFPSAAAQITSGKYRIESDAGLLAGSYRIEIQAYRKSGMKIEADEGSSEMVDALEPYIPAEYNAQTTLRRSISTRSVLDFELSSK